MPNTGTCCGQTYCMEDQTCCNNYCCPKVSPFSGTDERIKTIDSKRQGSVCNDKTSGPGCCPAGSICTEPIKCFDFFDVKCAETNISLAECCPENLPFCGELPPHGLGCFASSIESTSNSAAVSTSSIMISGTSSYTAVADAFISIVSDISRPAETTRSSSVSTTPSQTVGYAFLSILSDMAMASKSSTCTVTIPVATLSGGGESVIWPSITSRNTNVATKWEVEFEPAATQSAKTITDTDISSIYEATATATTTMIVLDVVPTQTALNRGVSIATYLILSRILMAVFTCQVFLRLMY